MKNALTVDLEDYFHVSAYSGKVRLEEWDSYPSRVAENTDRLLDLLAENNCLATFFVLGWVAEKKPEIVGRVAAAGHEIACHSLLHRKIFDLTPQEFREDTHRAKAVIEDATGKKVVGYRAPSFSVTRESSWALDTPLLWDSRCTPDSVLDQYAQRTDTGVPHAYLGDWIDEVPYRGWCLSAVFALQLHPLGYPSPEPARGISRVRLHSSLGAGPGTAKDGWKPLGAGAALFWFARDGGQTQKAGQRHGILPFGHLDFRDGAWRGTTLGVGCQPPLVFFISVDLKRDKVF